MQVLNTVGPLILVVALGTILFRTQFLPAAVFKANSRLVYWIGLPCLLFEKTAQPLENLSDAMAIFVVLLAGMLVSLALAYATAKVLRVTPWAFGSFLQTAFRGNLAYAGLPVIFFALAETGDGGASAREALAVLAIAPLVPIYNLIAVAVLVASQSRGGPKRGVDWSQIVRKTLTNPLIIACVLGLGWSLTGRDLPLLILRPCRTIGGMALPLALFSIGASLRLEFLHRRVALPLASSIIKVVLTPAAGYVIGRALGLSDKELCIAVIFLSCPTAVVSYIMAEEMSGDLELTAAGIIMSTLLVVPVWVVALWLLA